MEITDTQPDVNPEPKRVRCVTCGAKMKGAYCRKCGEKRIVPENDFSMGKFFRLALFHFVHFDSKMATTFWLLFSKPGFLAAEWTLGRRVIYMKPLQMFVVASVLFYFFLPTAMAHFSSYEELARGYNEKIYLSNLFHYDVKKAFVEKAAALQISEDALKAQVVNEAARRSKTCLFLLIPLLGALIFAFFYKKMPWLSPHLILAMYSLTFYILADLSIHAIDWIFGLKFTGSHIYLTLMCIFAVYQTFAFRQAYRDSWAITILKTIGIMAGFVALIRIYRQIMTLWVLHGI